MGALDQPGVSDLQEAYSGGNPEVTTTGGIKFGDVAGGNYTEIEDDGTIAQRGNAGVWDDLVGSLVANKLTSVAGGLQYNYAENTITMNTAGSITNVDDRLIFNYQKPHSARTDTEMKLHIHWEQVSTNQIEFTVQYRVQENGVVKDPTWVTATANSVDNSAFVYPGTGTFNQITSLVSVDLTSYALSSLVQFRVARTDSTAGDIEATFMDAHIQRDSTGSRQEYVK